MTADQMLIEHHEFLRGLCRKITAMPAAAPMPAATPERQERVDDLVTSSTVSAVLSGAAGACATLHSCHLRLSPRRCSRETP